MKKLLLLLILTFHLQISAQQTYVPDDIFEQALIDQGYDDVLDDYVLTANINTITELELPAYNIQDLTGIEDFAALEILFVGGNSLDQLDVSQNTALKQLYCHFNSLTQLDISQNMVLTDLWCSYNELSNLDISQNTALTDLYCNFNNLTQLDISQNMELESLNCSRNLLTNLNVSQHTALKYLQCGYNELTILDISQNLGLITYTCHSNLLTHLDISQHTSLGNLRCSGNQLLSLNIKNGNNINMWAMIAHDNPNLTCIQVDDENATYPECNTPYPGWCKDEWAEYSENCPPIGIEESLTNNRIKVFPNPITNQLFVNNSNTLNIQSIKLYDVLGKKVFQELNNFEQIDVSTLKTGVYLVKIETDKGVITKKVVKE